MEEKSPHKAPLSLPNIAPPSLIKTDSTFSPSEEQGETGVFSKNCSQLILHIKKRKKPQKWSDSDTSLFFTCLEIYGMDFRMMRSLLSPKTQRQVVRKFHKEKKRNPFLIEKALKIHESNKISTDPKKPINFLDHFLNCSSDSDRMSAEMSEDELRLNFQAADLRLSGTSWNYCSENGVDEEIMPLEYYLRDWVQSRGVKVAGCLMHC